MTSIPTIEELWQALRRRGGEPLQQRVDATHPLDLYVEFEPPGRPGLVAVCANRPPLMRAMRSVTLEEGHRSDGRWSLRLSLDEPSLFPVFAALCHDIVEFTRAGINEVQIAAAVVARLDHWRNLLERDSSGLGDSELRGLIGELSVFERLLDQLTTAEAVDSWTGPLGTPQDFMLPTGQRIEVKAARPNATTVRINGLGQLDAGVDALMLAVVRIEDTGVSAPGATTVSLLVERLKTRLAVDPEALAAFSASLAFAGWHDHPRHQALVVRVVSIDCYLVDSDFPRLITTTVPAGVQDADYSILLPARDKVISEIIH
jgi:hypothetical protein